MSNGLWSQLGASDIVQSCGAELAEVLNQVDILIEKKRQEWETDLIKDPFIFVAFIGGPHIRVRHLISISTTVH